MQFTTKGAIKRFGKRAFRILICLIMVLQTLWIPNSALAASAFYFRGFGSENVTSNTFAYATSGATVSGTTVTASAGSTEGMAVGLINLNEDGHDISQSVDLGGLEIDFSTLTTVTQEGTNGTENDVPTVDIDFCSTNDIGSSISSVHLTKPNNAVSGGVTLSSGAHIPSGTRSIFITLTGTNTNGDNTVVFSNTSLVIRDAGAPSCSVDYNKDWTNQDVTVTVTASDADAGLEGIYRDGALVSATSPYSFVVFSNNTSFSIYAKDLAGKQSDAISETVNKIDKTVPTAPSSVPLSNSGWSNADVTVTMPALGTTSGAPERYVYQTGTSAWADLPANYAISANGYTTIRVAVEDAAGNRSSYAEATAKIDKLAPTIGTPTLTVGSGSTRVDVTATEQGLSGLKRFAYAAGTQTADYFAANGTDIVSNTFTITTGGNYTVFASDNAGNTALLPLSLTTAPTMAAISDVSIDEDQTKNVPLTVSDAESTLSELSVKVTTTNDALLSTVTVNKADTGISLDITPAANQSGGPVTVTVEVSDPGGLKVTRSFNVTVNAVNDPPVAQNDSGIVLDEDTTATIDVLANDTDLADGDTLSIASVGTPAHGKALIVLGKIRYTPDANYSGTDSFVYTVSDGKGGTADATVSVTVNNVNDAPVAKPDTATAREDIAATINVLSNDFDVDTAVNTSEHISLLSSTNGSHGTTAISDGMIVYTPAANFNGTDTFTYTIEDNSRLTAEATVTVVVSPESDDPIFNALSNEYTINEDAKNAEIAFEISDVETPLNSVMLQAASLNTAILEQSGITISGLGDNSAAVKLLLSPVADQYGDVDILLTLGDGFNTVERTITVHVQNVNDAPRAGADTVNYTEGAAYVDISIADLLKNDSDIEGDTIFYDGLVSPATVGTIEELNSTTLRYTPVGNYDGSDSFTYYISDGAARTLATCTLKATAVNDAPTISVEEASYRTNEDTKVVIPFRISDQESSAASLSVVAATSDDDIATTDGMTIVNNGDGTGEVQITPAADANGTVTVTLTVSDGEAQSSDSFQLVVDPVQDAPIAVNDKVYVLYSGSRTFSVLENDHDVDGDTLTVANFVEDLPGTLNFDKATQKFTYYPAIGENAINTFTYTLTDGKDTASATVTLNVSTIKHAPMITSIDSKYVGEDGSISGISFSVTDEDYGDTASITVTPANTTILPNDAEHIQVTNHGDGVYSLSLTPAANKFGTTSVTVTVTDSTSLTDSTTFNLVIMGQNDPPLAVNDEFTINEDSSLALTLLANDSDPDGDTIWLSSISSASHGYIESNGRNYTYYPYGDWNGTDTITYRVSDGRTTSQATATITVNPVNDRPVAWDDWRELPNNVAGESANISVLSNDYDVDAGDVIHTYQIVTAPRHGTAVINADGTITYTRTEASLEGNGADSFVYRIIDREAATGEYSYDDATVHIGIEFISSLYTYGRSVTCYEDADAFNFDLSISNPNNVPYTLTVNTPTTLGTFEVLDNNTVRFTPAPDQYGYANITYTVEQNNGGTEKSTGTIWLRVYPVNDPPVIDSAPAKVTMDEDTAGGSTFDVTFHDPDCANNDLYFYVYTQNATTTGPIPFQTGYSVSRNGGTATVTVTTAANVNGTGEIVVGVSDGISYDEKVIDLTVTPVDDPPVVNSVERTIYEDSKVTFASPGSDSEADGDTTKESILTEDAPQHGTATINSNHTILYVPDANFFGTDIFYVTITDQTTAALSSRAKVTINVTPVNDQPEIFDLDYYQSTLEDTEKDVTLTVIDVDNDLSGAESYTITSSDQSLVKDENISIVNVSGNQMKIHLIPEANANGTLVVSIVASDGSLTAEGAFELKVIPVNDIPIANNDTGNMDEAVSTGAESTPPKSTTTLNLLANDSDIEDGKPKIVSITNVVNGTVTNLGNGSVTVSADGDSTADVTFTYTVMDRAGATASATVTVTINPMNDPPRAKDDYLTIDEDAQPSISVLSNDSDPEGDTLSILAVSVPKHGTATINGTKVDYVPTKDYYGTDYFTYTVSDGNGGTATATVHITLKPVNDAPTIEQITSGEGGWSMEEDTTASFDFAVADAETAVSGLIIKITSLDPAIIKTEQISLSTSESGNKTITVTPEANAHGEARIKFVVSDGLLSTNETYFIMVISMNDAPVVTAEKQQTKEDTALSASATATDADGDSVTFAKSTDPAHGTVVVSADGTYVYTPSKDFNGEDSFVILADDGNTVNHVGYATVYITVTPDGDPPIAGDDSITIDEDTPSVIPVLDNDSDPDASYGDKISIYRISTPAHGTAVVDDGGILYTPAADYNGTDSFTYTITDLDGKMDTASVSITINPVNDTPRGGNDTATVLEDHSVTIDAAANDDVDETTNPTLEDVTITQVDDPAHGTAVIDAGLKTITYTPDANWFSPTNEPEVFYYTATDSSGKSAQFSITVTVTSVNDLPVITPDKLADVVTDEDTATGAITFTVSDIETAAGSLSVSVTHNNSTLLPTVTVTPDASGVCSFTVTPKANKVGTATFTVTVTDADGGTDSDTFKLTVNAVNDLPTATDDAFTVAENSSRVFNVLANDDVDILPNNGGDTLTLLSIATPQYGTATIENNQLKYVPDSTRPTTANYTDVFTYTMKDASNHESTATVTVTITPVNDPPTMTAIADVTGILEDAPDGTGAISFSVTDEEDDDDTLQITIESSNTTLFPLGNITVVNPTDDATGALRTVKAIPAANQFGTGNIKLTVRDAQGLTYSRTFSVTVESVNDIPTNGNESFEVTEDVEKQLDVLTGIDVDYASNPADFTVKSIATAPTHGTAYVAADGKSIYYKTAQDSNLPDSFEYTIHDAYGDADYTFTASITVIPVNDAPVITYTGAASYETYQGIPKNGIPFTVTDVDNVTDASGTAPVEVTLSTKSSNTLLLRNGIKINTLTGNDRSIDLQPYLKWNGTTTVTITAKDPGGLTATASFQLIVNNVNDSPVAVNDSGIIVQEDKTTAVYVLVNDLDDDLLTNPDTEFIKIKSVVDNDPNATIVPASDGLSVLVTPNANYNGPVSFTYTIEDALHAESNSATVSLTVSQVNDAPVAGNDTKTTVEDTAVVIPVLENDSDVDMDKSLNAHWELESIGVVITGTTLVKAAHGSISTDGTTITYTPNKDYNGSDTFQYYCSDGDTQTVASVTVTITQVNDAPVANPDTARIDEDSTTGYIDVMANDTDVDTGATLNQNDQYLTSLFSVSAAWIDDLSIGTVDLTGNKIKFTPATNWNGTAVVHYTLQDGYGASCDSTLTVTVDPVNDLPVFSTAPQNITISEDGANGTTDIVVGDVETAASSLAVTVTNSSKPSLIATTDVTVTKGTNGNRTITVNPKDNQNGEATITLQVDDLTLGKTTITFVVTVTAVNDDPVADDKTLNIAEDANTQTITKASVAHDVDIATNLDVLTLSITTAASHGTAAIDGSGNITYKPLANFNGTDTFVYTATDKEGATDTGTVTVNVSQVNDAPVTGNDTKTTAEDTAVVIPVLENDSDVDMDKSLNAHWELESIGVVITGTTLVKAAHGSITTDGTTITYTPNKDYNGSDTFQYYCSDGDTQTVASVTVTITQVNDAPVANPDTARIDEDSTTGYIDVMANDTDVDTGATLNQNDQYLTSLFSVSAAWIDDLSIGTVDLTGNKIKFTPATNWNGTAVVHYTLLDGYGASCDSTLTVTVDPVNDLPVFSTPPQNITVAEDGANGTTDIVVGDVETAASSLAVTVTNSSKPSLIATTDVTVTKGTNGNRTITVNPKDNQNGEATITLQVDDLTLGKTTITFVVTVTAVNDNPVADDKTLNIAEDANTQTITKASVAHDVDIATNLDVLTLTITGAASHGTAAIDGSGNITYKPIANFNGTDTFVYTATDKEGATDTGTVTVNVSQVNDAPVTGNDTKTTAEDTAVVIPVLENDSDVDMDKSLNAHWELESIGVVITGTTLTKPAHGSISTDGTTITYTPNKDYNGSDTFQYYCSDGDTQTVASVTVTITQVDDSPVANPDTARIDEDSATDYIDVMANDTDVDLDSALNQDLLLLRSKFYISAAWLTDTSIGTIDLKDYTIKFTPKANWFGTANILYNLQDGYGASCVTGLTVTVDPVNDLPVFSTPPQNITVAEDGANGTTDIVVGDVETAASSLAVTVLESSNPSLIATTDVTVTKGTNGNRTITVNPKDNQNGEATITLQVDDLTLGKTTITFVVTVTAVNDDPVADDKTLNIAEDANTQTITKASVAHDVDITTNADVLTLTITTAASHGTAAIDADGNITYKPLANFNGTDTFVYTATDKEGATDTGTVTVNVSPVNDAPVTGDDAKTTAEDTAVVISVLDNDSDVDMDKSLNAHWELESIGVVITGTTLAKAAHGSISTDGTTITYTPNKDYNGTDTFEYYCSDGEEQVKASVTVTITQVNDDPIAVSDSGSTDEDVPVSVNVLENDTDVDTSSSLNENELHQLSDLSITSCAIFGTAHGTIVKNGASIDYDPEPDFYGTQTIHYVLSDGHGGTSAGTLIIEVGSQNDAPVAVNDETSADEDHIASINVLDNDTDVDTGDTKTFVGFTEPISGLPGTFTTNAKGDITFTPNANYNGSFSIRYQMKDTAGLTSIAKLTVTINQVNDTPTANAANVTTDEDHAKGTDVSGLIGDVDILTNADELTVTVESEGEPQHGTVAVSGTTITYTPDANYNGSDEIVYTVTDKAGAHASAKLSITVNPVNDAPIAVDDTKTTKEDTAVTIAVRSNDSDIDTDALLNKTPAAAPVIESVTNGTHGKATTDGETITYTPDKDFNGTDEISYVLSDGSSTDEAKVKLTITQVNDQIQAVDDTAQTNDEDLVTIDVLKNDTDIDTDTALNKDALHLVSEFTLTAVGTPEHGTAKIASGKIEYTPEDRFAGTDRFTYTVSDGHGSSQTAWISVNVLSVNDPPVIIAVSKPQTGDRAGTGSKVTVEWTGFDIDGDTLTYKLDYFDGTSWHPIADNLSGTSYIFSIPDSLVSTNGLKFRVNVRDSEYTSDYGYSGIMSVDKDAPTGSVVTMRTADGRAYTAGAWTNQTVTVVAASAVDASKVTYYYAMDDGTSAAATSMDVVAGVHTVNILATDEYGNTTNLGGYLARVDKQQPAEPDISESISGGAVVLSFTFHTDPGGSGNNKITLPDGTVASVGDQPTFTVTKNGTYNFSLTDIAGNRRTFTYTVGKVDTSSPVIALNSGAYSVGTKTQDAISATLTFTDAQSEITARGYQISTSSTASGTYRTYSSALTLSDPGTYYIHAMAKNAFGLTTYQTFGPFIIEAAAVPQASPTPVPTSGDVVVTKEDVEEIPGDAVSIRLPGGEWSDTLTLENVEPGTYLVEVKDKDGNIRTVEVRVTKRDIVARSVRSAKDNVTPAAVATIAGAAALMIFLLLAIGHNVTITVTDMLGGAEKNVRTLRRLRGRKKEFIIKLDNQQVKGGKYAVVKLAKALSKEMRGNTVVVNLRGVEVLREMIPEDNKEAFIRTISID